MSKNVFQLAFALGAMAVLWVAAGFLGSNHLALVMTLAIAGIYVMGALELHRYRQITESLRLALEKISTPFDQLEDWIAGVPPSLQNIVRLRIEGERVPLPSPGLTPYLVGLLVMLGMLGTFLGMVVTLKGAVFALEGTTDLQAIRAAFAAPIKGLGLSFGTSVAGVATSAMLGLMSALCRRDRLAQAQTLDTKIATVLRKFTLAHQRQETYKALQAQSQALPAMVQQMQTMMSKVEQMSEQLKAGLQDNQNRFHQDIKGVYTELAQSVDHTLRTSLNESAQTAAQSFQPVVLAAMTAISDESSLQHARLAATTQNQFDALAERLSGTANQVTHAWTAAVTQQEQAGEALITGLTRSMDGLVQNFAQQSTSLLAAVEQSHDKAQAAQVSGDASRLQAWLAALESQAESMKQQWKGAGETARIQQQQVSSAWSQAAQEMLACTQSSSADTLSEISRLANSAEELAGLRIAADQAWSKQQDERMAQMTGMLQVELNRLRDEESLRGQAAVDRLSQLQADVREHLSTLGASLEEPITRLIATASEAPRAAAQVIGQLRQEVSESVVRDNELLEERTRILATLNRLLDGIKHASAEQKSVIDSLVSSSAAALGEASQQFGHKVEAETAKLSDIADHVTSSAVDVSALSETLRYVMQSFNEANEKMIGNLARIEGALEKSMARSDDQLAYYVAQAREIIDLSLMSQKGMVDEIRKVGSDRVALTAEVAR